MNQAPSPYLSSPQTRRDKRLQRTSKMDGGEQTEMWVFKAGTARESAGVDGAKGQKQSLGGLAYDTLSLLPRGLVYFTLLFLFHNLLVL